MSENEAKVQPGALVLYRGRPARVAHITERVEIDLGGETLRVRNKDIQVLHPGPLASLSELKPAPGEMRAAWEILAGTNTNLVDLAELAFGKYTPATSWAAWQFVADGLYFSGTPSSIQAANAIEVGQREEERRARDAEENAWSAFLERANRGEYEPVDERFHKEIEQMAYGLVTRSRALRDLGRGETPENAHSLLLALGVWDEKVNPHPRRLRLPALPPQLDVPETPDETRADLTDLEAFAIDDAGSDTPDDAISLEGERIWVHVADPAALVAVDSALDLEARGRAETLHLPEGHVHLFPPGTTRVLGLGLQNISPALSFGIIIDDAGAISSVEVRPSKVKVKRLTYETANEQMDSQPFSQLEALLGRRRARRIGAGAIDIDLPEVKIHVDDAGEIEILPVLSLRSRRMVEEAMILAGEAAAKYAVDHQIPVPFSVQEAPEIRVPHETLSGMFSQRRYLRRSQYRTTPANHSGLGVPYYVQASSPLRRYLDLVVHQQIRSFLHGEELLGESEVLERIGMVEAVLPALREGEIRSEKHWTLAYLKRNLDWQGKAVLVERKGASGLFIIPMLGLEIRATISAPINLDDEIDIVIAGIDLPNLDSYIKLQFN